jgi:hypothetical protein
MRSRRPGAAAGGPLSGTGDGPAARCCGAREDRVDRGCGVPQRQLQLQLRRVRRSVRVLTAMVVMIANKMSGVVAVAAEEPSGMLVVVVMFVVDVVVVAVHFASSTDVCVNRSVHMTL